MDGEGADVASASDCNIWTTDGNTVHVTGTTTITDWGTAPQAGAWKWVIFDGATQLTYNATTNKLNTNAANYTTTAGDRALVYAESVSSYVVTIFPLDGNSPVNETRFQAFTTPGTYTNGFTVPATTIWLDIVGGGGGSGAEDSAPNGPGGGGSGAGIRGFCITGLTVGATLDVVVGAAGAGGTVPGANAGTDGGTGGNSIVRVGGGGSTYVSCNGGLGGGGQTGGTYAGGTAGTSTYIGYNSQNGTAGSAGQGGAGAYSIFGPGGVGGTGTSGNSPPATSYGR